MGRRAKPLPPTPPTVNKPLLGRRPPKIPPGGGPGLEIPPRRGPEIPEPTPPANLEAPNPILKRRPPLPPEPTLPPLPDLGGGEL